MVCNLPIKKVYNLSENVCLRERYKNYMKEVSGVTCDSSSYVKEFKESRGDKSVCSWNVLKRTPLRAADKTYMDRITAQP